MGNFLLNNNLIIFYLSITVLDSKIRINIFNEIIKKFNIESNLSQLYVLLSKVNRVYLLPYILEYVFNIFLDKSKISHFDIYLTDKTGISFLPEIVSSIEKQIKNKIIYNIKIDPQIIAGFKALSNELEIDLSLNGFLNSFFKKVKNGN